MIQNTVLSYDTLYVIGPIQCNVIELLYKTSVTDSDRIDSELQNGLS